MVDRRRFHSGGPVLGWPAAALVALCLLLGMSVPSSALGHEGVALKTWGLGDPWEVDGVNWAPDSSSVAVWAESPIDSYYDGAVFFDREGAGVVDTRFKFEWPGYGPWAPDSSAMVFNGPTLLDDDDGTFTLTPAGETAKLSDRWGHHAWSPDSGTVAIGTSTDEIFLVPAVPGAETPVTGLDALIDPGPMWFSPDGTDLLVRDNCCTFPMHLWIVELDGSGSRRVSGDTNETAYFTGFSPDGSRLAWREEPIDPDPPCSGNTNLYIADGEGAGRAEVPQLPTSYASLTGGDSWSPDSKRLMWTEPGHPPGTPTALRVMRESGQLVTIGWTPSGQGYVTDQVWSPDGRWVLFSGTAPCSGDVPPVAGPPGATWLVEVETCQAVKLDDSASRDHAFSPDGTQVRFTRVGGGVGTFHIQVDGTRLTPQPSGRISPDFTRVLSAQYPAAGGFEVTLWTVAPLGSGLDDVMNDGAPADPAPPSDSTSPTPSAPGSLGTGNESQVTPRDFVTAFFDGINLHIRLKCPARFKPFCQGGAVAVTAKDQCKKRRTRRGGHKRAGEKMAGSSARRARGKRTRRCVRGKPMSSFAKGRQKPRRWKLVKLRVKRRYRAKVARMAKRPNKKLLVVKQALRAKRFKRGHPQVVFHKYRVRSAG